MKYVVLVPDGCADEPVDALGGRTPLEAAAMPHLQQLALRSEVGRAAVIPPGLPPGSDVGNLAILGYDPREFHTGRAPIEAAAMGVDLGPDEVAYRCNLVTLGGDDTMVDFAAGHLTSEQSHPIVAALDRELGGGRDGVRFHAGVEYRHLAVVPRDWSDAECVPPHDLTGRAALWPTGAAAPKLMALMEASRPVVAEAAAAVDSVATQIWLWGQGVRPTLPPFAERYGVEGRLTSAVDLVRGLGVLAGIEVLDVPGASAGFDNDYGAQRDACLASLADRDFFLLHVEATDEAGHQQDVEAKVDALEAWDREIIGPLLEALPEFGAHRVLLMPDHATPLRLGTHTSEPVPYLLSDSERPVEGRPYREDATATLAPVPAHGLMTRMTTGARTVA
jgi:2,3-bisphosphoglycerate-independent phosphoglycerate mutase